VTFDAMCFFVFDCGMLCYALPCHGSVCVVFSGRLWLAFRCASRFVGGGQMVEATCLCLTVAVVAMKTEVVSPVSFLTIQGNLASGVPKGVHHLIRAASSSSS
jgi:hypothetical protein